MRKLITIIVTGVVVSIVLLRLMPNSLPKAIQTVQDTKESLERGG
jgi:uncharacterized membrane-anchored protein YhcB (DUF1043 family)